MSNKSPSLNRTHWDALTICPPPFLSLSRKYLKLLLRHKRTLTPHSLLLSNGDDTESWYGKQTAIWLDWLLRKSASGETAFLILSLSPYPKTQGCWFFSFLLNLRTMLTSKMLGNCFFFGILKNQRRVSPPLSIFSFTLLEYIWTDI